MNQTTSGATLTKATGGAARIPRMQRYRWESSVSLNPLARKTFVLEPDELSAWWVAVGDLQDEQSRRALRALLVSGLRLNELLQLRWADIDEARRRLTITDSKTGPFTKTIGPELASWLAEWRPADHGVTKSSHQKRHDDKGRVFNLGTLRAALAEVETKGGKRVSANDLR